MDLTDKEELTRALARLRTVFNTSVPVEVQEAYLSGRLLDPGIYEKVGTGSLDGHPLWAYFLMAEGFLRQPSLECYYDIFRASRTIPLLRSLDMAMTQLAGVETSKHVARARDARTFDGLESTLFELIVAAAYQRRFSDGKVVFLEETPDLETPDFEVTFPHSKSIFVECKKLNRNNDFQAEVRKQARTLLSPLLWQLRLMRMQALVQVTFRKEVSQISPTEVMDAFMWAVGAEAVETESLLMEVGPLGPSDEDFLYPSPKYFYRRFRYDPERWHGLIPALEGRRYGVSFFESASWDSAVLWRLDTTTAAWKANKFNFKLLFKGLDQLRPQRGETNLHVWIERDSAWGHRAKHLREFCRRIEGSTEVFSHLLFNETFAQVTPGGYFDFQEHVSGLGGPKRTTEESAVLRVFTQAEDGEGSDGEWGVGAILPSLDELGGKVDQVPRPNGGK